MFFTKIIFLKAARLLLFIGLVVAVGCQQAPLELDPVPSLSNPAPQDQPADSPSESPDSQSEASSADSENDDSTAVPENVEEENQEDEPTLASGRIAYIDLEGGLFTINPDGSEERQLSEDGSFFRFPAWSPTNNDIAVIGFSEEGSGVFVFNDSEAAENRSIYENETNSPIYLYWHPQGEQVSFITPSEDEGGLALHLVAADGSGDDAILATGQPFYWQWLKNNRQALIHAGGDRLSFLDMEGNESETGLGMDGFFQAPAISHTNRFFAYQEADSDGRTLQIKDIVEDDVIHQQPHKGILTMAWHPHALQLAYVSPPDDNVFIGPLISYDVSSGDSTTLVPHNVLTFFWSPDGRYIAFLTPDELSRQTDNPAVKTKRSRLNSQGRSTLAIGYVDVENGTVHYIADFIPTSLFVRQFIPFFDQYALSHRIWSPDSQFVVLPVFDQERDRPVIQVFALDGRPPFVIGDGVSAFWSHQ